MVKISFSASEVQATISNLQGTYTSLKSTLDELNRKNGELANFWSGDEASRFNEKLSKVTQSFANFDEKYKGYLSFLDSVITAYVSDSESFLAVLNSYKS